MRPGYLEAMNVTLLKLYYFPSEWIKKLIFKSDVRKMWKMYLRK